MKGGDFPMRRKIHLILKSLPVSFSISYLKKRISQSSWLDYLIISIWTLRVVMLLMAGLAMVMVYLMMTTISRMFCPLHMPAEEHQCDFDYQVCLHYQL